MKFGKAFSDSLVIEQKTSPRFVKPETPSWWLGAGRALLFATLLVVAFFILIIRLFQLTIIQGHELRSLADGNRTRELVRHAPRGLLLDRTGKPLVTNVAEYRLVKPCENFGNETCVTRVSQAEGEELTREGLPPGTFIEVDFSRRYPYAGQLSHVLGYTGELSQAELSDEYYSLRHYRPGDLLGRSGAEQVFEEKLRGRDGGELVEINAAGNPVRTLGRDNEVPGQDVTLSIDAGLSAAVADAFNAGLVGLASSGYSPSGAVIVTKPATGEILALYSSPSFDSNRFAQGLSDAQYQALINDPNKPLFDRAIAGVYPPGSTFKILMALAGIEEGAIDAETRVLDSGVLTIGQFSFPNWYYAQYGKTEGEVDIIKAIERSNDIFFYKVGEWLGITRIASWARKVGLGKPLGLELPGEAGGLVPDPAWKEAHFSGTAERASRNNLWYLGDTYHMSIGQGYLLTTPLQVNALTNVVASGGKLCRPTIEKISNLKLQTANCKDLKIKPETIRLIAEGMKRACEPGGTGWPLFNFSVKRSRQAESSVKQEGQSALPTPDTFSVPLACKTGTAEFGDPKNRTHAWFTAFAPLPKEYLNDTFKGETLQGVDSNEGERVLASSEAITGDPEISVTVLVEAGGEGSNVAAPIAKKILEVWFSR